MLEFQKLGIYLNDEPGDDEALAFAGRLAEFANSESVLCMHVRGVETAPAGPAPDYEKLRQHVLNSLPPAVAARCTVVVQEGQGIAEILRTARDESLDLLVVGRRPPHDQRAVGSAFVRLARKAPCSVLVTPDGARPHFARILVATDCSDHSRRALLAAIDLARTCREPNPQVILQSIYSVSYGYSYTGQSFPEAVKAKEELSRRELGAFIAEIDHSGVHFETVCTCSNDPNAAVYDLVAARNLDLIAVGSRGMSAAAAALLGSFTERVLINAPAPVLVVKKKGENIRLLEALLSG